jgi:hypothetical protein
MKLRYVLPIAVVLGLGVVSLAIASTRDHGHGNKNGNQFTAFLISENETPLALHTNGTGKLTLTVNSNSTLSYTLTYSGLSSAANVAHVHFGKPSDSGGVIFYLCGGPKPACPAGGGTVSGTIAAADIMGPTAQGLAVGDFNGALKEIRAGFTYANVHSTTYPGGEIRGQLGRGQHEGDDDEDDD